MKVVLISRDRDLYDVCRGVLRQLSIEGPTLEPPGSRHGKADLTIWDITPDNPIPERVERRDGALDLFVTSKAALAKGQLGTVSGFGILVKPVKRPILAAFLSVAISRQPGGKHKTEDHLKSPGGSRDELLQLLLETNLRLQEYDQERTNFLARALHDFRTPLTALHGYCGMLLRESAGSLDPGQVELLERMQHSTTRLSTMSKAMFELTSQNNAERRPNLIRSNIDACVQNAVHQIMPMAQDKGINVNVDMDPPDTHLYMDAGAIEQVIVNLLENACKFTKRAGSIDVTGRLAACERLSRDGSSSSKEIPGYRIEVQDNGMGILPEHLSSIFEEYTSYGGAQDRSGGGLGLAICKKVISEHHGVIGAQSDRQGTRISFVLPLQHEMVIGPTPAAQPLASAAVNA